MSDQHVQPPWYANGHAVYMGADGGFSLRCCPNPEANARHIVKAVNYHDRLREALREVTATLAWVAHGECRAIQDDPIMPSAQAQEVARALLAELDNLEKQQ